MSFDAMLMLVAFFVLTPDKVLYSAIGALMLSLVLMFNHRPHRYMACDACRRSLAWRVRERPTIVACSCQRARLARPGPQRASDACRFPCAGQARLALAPSFVSSSRCFRVPGSW
ncbi:hypothetical protein ACSAHN_08460 [Xanthomonas citri pv. bilvae]